MNDDLPMDFEKLQMLWCIIVYELQKTLDSILRKGLIKYNMELFPWRLMLILRILGCLL
jgi:hypothetical protein